jgi:GntR family transcriptional repressor for pyruvate dehydrogenase complex
MARSPNAKPAPEMIRAPAVQTLAPALPRSQTGSFQPVKTRRIFEEICESIREKVVAGELKAGDRLPPERDLSEMFAVSRTALREALRSLEIAGIVELKKGSKGGAFITENGVGQVTRSFRDMLDFGMVSLGTLLEARQLVMDVVVRTACERATPDDIAALRTNIDETIALTQAGRYEDRTLKAVEFSTLLANATGNAVMAAILEAMASVIRGFVVIAGPPAHDPLIKSRKRLIAQIEARDATGACETMRSYLASLTKHLLATEASRKQPAAQGRSRAMPQLKA